MAEINCPHCNRVNDSIAERCWSCNSLLAKPSDSSTEQEQVILENSNEVTPQAGEPNPVTSQTATNQNEIPDWLARIRELKQQDEPTDAEEKLDWSNQGESDWLRRLAAGENKPASVDAENLDIENELTIESVEPLENKIRLGDNEVIDAHEDEIQFVDNDTFQEDLPAEEVVINPVTDEFISPGTQDSNEILDIPLIVEPIEAGDLTLEAESEVPFVMSSDDLPDWLSDDQHPSGRQPESAIGEEKRSQFNERKLEKAHLPAWLTAIRPSENETEDTPIKREQPVNSGSGILEGIDGALPNMEMLQQEKVTFPFASELQVSQRQSKNAELFKLLLQPEETSTPVGKEKASATGRQKYLRLLVTTLLLLSVILPMFSRTFLGVVPALYSNEVVDSLGMIEALPVDKPVLLAAHFEPGLAGEMNWTTQPVLKHLVSRKIPMALMSTNVAGFAILQDFVNQAVVEGSVYSIEENVVNLGYLPGGTIGLGALVKDPITALPFTTDIQLVSEVEFLKGVTSLADFGSLILITDNPEFARSWVEQIDQAGVPVETLAIVSAQAAPLIQPYYSSGQVTGYVPGVNGAMSYELLRLAPGFASTRFHVYQAAQVMAIVIILAGGIFTLITGSSSTSKKEEKR